MTHKQTLCFGQVHRFLDGLFDGDLHAKRVLSLANATLGVISTASLAVNTIGQGLALARGRMTKHAVKQVDRLLSNPGIDVDAALRHWVPHVVGPRTAINVAMDWTEFDADGQATIMLSLMTRHGRATPLVWLTVDKSTLKDRRNEYQYQALVRLADALPADVAVCIVADRGFGDQKLYRVLTEELKFDYVIRFRGNIAVAAADGEVRTAAGWVGPGGRARVLRGASVTAERYKVGSVLCVQRYSFGLIGSMTELLSSLGDTIGSPLSKAPWFNQVAVVRVWIFSIRPKQWRIRKDTSALLILQGFRGALHRPFLLAGPHSHQRDFSATFW